MNYCLLISGFSFSACENEISQQKPDKTYGAQNSLTVTDLHTGLMWQRCSLGLVGTNCDSGTLQAYTWQGALKVANENSYFGYSDWRLPNIKELQSLVDLSCLNPAINENFFPNTAWLYWSGSPYDDGVAHIAWNVNFYSGVNKATFKDDVLNVRLVRSIY